MARYLQSTANNGPLFQKNLLEAFQAAKKVGLPYPKLTWLLRPLKSYGLLPQQEMKASGSYGIQIFAQLNELSTYLSGPFGQLKLFCRHRSHLNETSELKQNI